MIRFEPPPEPERFHEQCRTKGNTWLAEHPGQTMRPPAYWRNFTESLSLGFRDLCAYSAMNIPPGSGTVDHYLSWRNHPNLTYEWSNYRYAAPWINSSKGTLDDKVLDPFEVQDDWFEVLLPSLQLVLTDKVPEEYRDRAEFTLERLHLRDDERVIRQRRQWYEMYESGQLPLDGLRKLAPLIARAVERKTSSEDITAHHLEK